MMLGTRYLAAVDSCFRPVAVMLPSRWVVRLYSRARGTFLDAYVKERPPRIQLPEALETNLWGLKFRSPVLNAAGMFKSGDGYSLVALQGAGGFLSGTSTATARSGNEKDGFKHPFAPYPSSGASSNWLGLPNSGHQAVANLLSDVQRVEGCPLGASLGADPAPDISPQRKLDDLVSGLRAYEDAGVDFLEINESCPNTEAEQASFDQLIARLEHVSREFLAQRRRHLPVIIKFSNDTELGQVPRLLDTLLNLGFDGVNFGNTSVSYSRIRKEITGSERRLFDFFSSRFGGGVSGRPLKQSSLRLVSFAAEHLSALTLDREFHIIRTGGVEDASDVRASLEAGASLVQWYTGYFEAFARSGHRLYERLYDSL